MGVRGEVFSTRVMLPNRTYFFNVKENRMGDLYLNIVESKNRDSGGFDRQSVVLFADDMQEFLKGFDESLRVMEKAVREKRRGNTGGDAPRRSARSSQPDEKKHERDGKDGRRDKSRHPAGEKPARSRKPGMPGPRSDRKGGGNFDRRPDRKSGGGSDRRPERGFDRKPERGSDRRPEKGKRVVVKKRQGFSER